LLVVEDTEPAEAEVDDNPAAAASLRPIAAAPCYLKAHGFGEYVFDWQWARASEQLGVPYYPKLVVAVPFAPVNGPKLLMRRETPDLARCVQLLAEGVWALRGRLDARSAHVLLCSEGEAQALEGPRSELEAPTTGRWLRRSTLQFQWHNPGVDDFDGFLATLRSRARKQVRRERAVAASHGLQLGIEPGDSLSEEDWHRVAMLYERGCHVYGSEPYLKPAFFEWIRRNLSEHVVLGTARDGSGRLVAMSFNLLGRDALYGRHWGALEAWPMLHFELCYYRLIAFAAERGLARFEAGSGGAHKQARGLEATICHSLHRLADPRLHAAIAAALTRERGAVTAASRQLADHGPRRRGPLAPEHAAILPARDERHLR
jgi:predicted N-acyltransferase